MSETITNKETVITDESVLESVEVSLGEQTFFSPYELIRVLNGLLGTAKPTQMAYNYVRKGLIPSSTRTSETGKTVKVVSRSDAAEWLVKYITKNS